MGTSVGPTVASTGSVGGIDVSVGDIGVSVGGTGVSVGGIGVSVGGIGVSVGNGVSVGSGVAVLVGIGVSVGTGTGVSVDKDVFVGINIEIAVGRSSFGFLVGFSATIDGCTIKTSTSSIAVPAFANVILTNLAGTGPNCARIVSEPETIPLKPSCSES